LIDPLSEFSAYIANKGNSEVTDFPYKYIFFDYVHLTPNGNNLLGGIIAEQFSNLLPEKPKL